ncbi:hypothetical protein [Cytobacillus purgationiresistens]|uniref:Uncharacterized protein n=1 Tax=Cytobacillus purgationiresistens TaxID=863449 RepID=A0ABU0AS75_9BACI|nr:hypothetical protein [Cytobacillus purgationiresistens]MDQ0273288.1 hypothetical protein [Cytobacillus purgationiresistens]
MYSNYRQHQNPNYYHQQEINQNYYVNNQQDNSLKQQTLHTISPAIKHGLREAQQLGFQHALTEAVAIGYLMGKGYNYETAWQFVESWWRPQGTPLPPQY